MAFPSPFSFPVRMGKPFLPTELQAIAKALLDAWKSVAERDDWRLLEEKEVSKQLHEKLQYLRDTKSSSSAFSSARFQVEREPKVSSWNEKRIDKMPDIVIWRNLNCADEGLHIECKLLDASHGKSTYLYVTEGLIRFVQGEYSARMVHGMLLAYVRDDSKLPDRLVEYFQKVTCEKAEACRPVNGLSLASVCLGNVYTSQHNRNHLHSDYPQIQIFHLWLS